MEGLSSSPKVPADKDYAQDGSVDLKGNPVLRSKRGGWFACYFIVVYEFFERMAYFGISSNLVLYLTRELHQGTVASANNVTYWVGTSYLMPVLGAFVADVYIGRYWTYLISAALYFTGMCLLTVAVSFRSLRPPPCNVHGDNAIAECKPTSTLQLTVFLSALYIIAFGSGGTKPNISTIGADQFDDFDPRERAHKISFFNWWFLSTFLGSLFAHIFLVFIQDNVGWSVGYGIPTAGLLLSVLIFLAGTPFYRHKMVHGSPLTRMARVLVAATRKWNVTVPENLVQLHELNHHKLRILPTNSLSFLNKAAVKVVGSTRTPSPWMLCTVTEVEETKQMVRLFPIWIASVIPASMVAQMNTLFVKQCTTLDRHIGKHFQIPPASFATTVTIFMILTTFLYDRYFVKIMKKYTANPRGITLLQRIGVGFFLHIVAMLVASLTENQRLRVARDLGLVQSGKEVVPRTIFVLLPQFALMGVADSFMIVGLVDLFYSQAPESMKSLGTSFSLTTYGIGNFLSSFLLSSVSNITEKFGARKGWILNKLNASHLDYYYALLVFLSFFNFVFFLYVSKLYVYKAEVFDQVAEEDCSAHEDKVIGA